MTAGELDRESELSTGAITTLLDRLERAGYVRRVRDDVDRRRILVELTDEARHRAWEIWGRTPRPARVGSPATATRSSSSSVTSSARRASS